MDRPVEELMDREAPAVDIEHSEIVAAHKIVHDGASCVVVTDSSRGAGVVTRTDLYKAIISSKVHLDTARSAK